MESRVNKWINASDCGERSATLHYFPPRDDDAIYVYLDYVNVSLRHEGSNASNYLPCPLPIPHYTAGDHPCFVEINCSIFEPV